MRPRVFPAEDRGRYGPGPMPTMTASMRPRVFPAEDGELHVLTRQVFVLQ